MLRCRNISHAVFGAWVCAKERGVHRKMVRYIFWLLVPFLLEAGSFTVTDSVATSVNDNTCFDRTFDIPVSSTITDVIIEVNIDHTWRADLDVSLTSPLGTVVDLTSDNGGSRNNLYTIFDDSAATSIVDDNANQNSVVSRQPEQPLSTFDGEDSSGIWTLTVCDDAGGDTGTYNYATLTIYNADPVSPPIVTAVPSQIAIINHAFSSDLSSYVLETDGDPISSYRLDGTLPAGLAFDTATGIISGTPTAVETQAVTLYATDKDGESQGQDFLVRTYPEVPRVDYHMDECFWFNSSAIVGDVRDSSPFGSNATSEGAVAVTTNTLTPPLCNYGTFGATGDRVQVEDTTVLNEVSTELTISVWLLPVTGSSVVDWVAAVMKTSTENWDDGFGLANNAADNTSIKFFVNGIGNSVSTALDMDTWNHIVGVYDGANLRIYKNGVEIQNTPYSNTITAVNNTLFIGNDLGDQYDDKWLGSIDEVKVWNYALTATEVQDIYNNESAGNNYDGTPRTCNTCSATVNAGVWELIGIPADLRTGTYTVADLIGDDITTTYGTDWIVVGRGYSDVNNSSWYNLLDLTTPLEFGKGYWLKSLADATWDVNDIEAVDYNSTSAACPAARCVEIDIRSVALEDGVDDLLGTGPYRYNLTGAVGKKPVDWADCRILIDGVPYTPSEAETAGYIKNQIWQYNPSSSSADGKGYTTCNDVTPGGCQLIPYKGFWMELHGPTKGKVVKLLIPEE